MERNQRNKLFVSSLKSSALLSGSSKWKFSQGTGISNRPTVVPLGLELIDADLAGVDLSKAVRLALAMTGSCFGARQFCRPAMSCSSLCTYSAIETSLSDASPIWPRPEKQASRTMPCGITTSLFLLPKSTRSCTSATKNDGTMSKIRRHWQRSVQGSKQTESIRRVPHDLTGITRVCQLALSSHFSARSFRPRSSMKYRRGRPSPKSHRDSLETRLTCRSLTFERESRSSGAITPTNWLQTFTLL